MMKKRKAKKKGRDVVREGSQLGHVGREDKDGYGDTRDIIIEREMSWVGDISKGETRNMNVEGEVSAKTMSRATNGEPISDGGQQIPGENQEYYKYYEETLRGEEEEEMSDISTDEMLSGMESDTDMSEEVKQFTSEGKLIYKHFYNEDITSLSEEIQEKEKMVEQINKTVWKLKNRYLKLEKHINNKKKEVTRKRKIVEEKKKLEEEENGMCVNIQAKNQFLIKQNEKLKYEREKNNEKIIKTQNDLIQCENSIEEMKEKLIDKEKELKEWTLQIDKLQKEEFEVEKFVLCQDKEIENITYKLEKLNLEKVEQEKKINKMKTKNLQLHMELQETIKENEKMEEEKKNLEPNGNVLWTL